MLKILSEACGNNPHMNCFTVDPASGVRKPKENVEVMRGVKESEIFIKVVYAEMEKVLEEWVGIELEQSHIYGVRR